MDSSKQLRLMLTLNKFPALMSVAKALGLTLKGLTLKGLTLKPTEKG